MNDETIGTRIEAIAAAKGIPGGAQLAKRFGVSYETLRKWREGETAPNRAKQAVVSRELGVPVGAFMFGAPHEHGVAHPMSPDTSNLPLLLSWEDVVSKNLLPEVFRLAMPDGSMASTPQGTVLFFSTLEKPRPGWGVLFEDKHGCRHIRRYVDVRPGHWRAEATAPGFSSFDSIEDGLAILAAMTDKLADGSM